MESQGCLGLSKVEQDGYDDHHLIKACHVIADFFLFSAKQQSLTYYRKQHSISSSDITGFVDFY